MSRKNGQSKNGHHTAVAAPPRFDASEQIALEEECQRAAPKIESLAPGMRLRVLSDNVTIELPAAAAEHEGYTKKFHKVELRLTDRDLAAAFKRLYYAMHDSNIRLAGGRHIDSASDVVRYILEQYAIATCPTTNSPS